MDLSELNEDVHFMMRCLHRHLPRHLITKPTRVFTSEEYFARTYGIRFVTFAREHAAVHMNGDTHRIRQDLILGVLRSWLSSKVNERSTTFQWEGFVMTPAAIESTTEMAFAEWHVAVA